MDLSGADAEMKGFLKEKFGECQALIELIDATPPRQIHRRRIEVSKFLHSERFVACSIYFAFVSPFPVHTFCLERFF